MKEVPRFDAYEYDERRCIHALRKTDTVRREVNVRAGALRAAIEWCLCYARASLLSLTTDEFLACDAPEKFRRRFID